MSREGKITKEELHPTTLVASNISVTDSNNYYAATEVEGILKEVGSKLSEANGKINSLQQEVGNARNLLESNINSIKGVL